MAAAKRKRRTKAEVARERREEALAQLIFEKEEQRLIDEQARSARIHERLDHLRIDHEAKKALAAEITRQRPFELPEVGWTAKDFLKEESGELGAVVEGLHYAGNNTLLVAEFKAGKTTLEVNLAKALADGTEFLGKFPTKLDGRVAFLNYEMDARQFRLWLQQAKVKRPERIVPLNIRGWQLPFWNEEEMLRLAEWLLGNEIEFMIIDPAARAWRGLVESESDNVQLGEFFGSLDELKRLAGVENLLIAAHKPRGAEDRARGGGEIEAWPDGNWYLRKEKGGIRSIRAEGRDILLDSVALDFDDDQKKLTAAGSVEEMVSEMDVMNVVSTLKSHGEMPSGSALKSAITGMSNDRKVAAIEKAVEEGYALAIPNGKAVIYRAK